VKIPFSSNLGTKLMALVLGVLIWGFAYTENLKETTITYWVQFTVPKDFTVSERRKSVPLKVKGPRRLIDLLRNDTPPDIKKDIPQEDLEDLEGDSTISISLSAEDFNLDERCTLPELPRPISITVSRQTSTSVPVTPTWIGKPAQGYVRSDELTQIVPSSVTVTGPKTLVDKAGTMHTRQININSYWSAETFLVDIDPVIDGQTVRVSPNRVKVTVGFEPDTVQKEFEIPLGRFLPLGYVYRVTLDPAVAVFTLEGTEQAMLTLGLNPGEIRAYIAVEADWTPRSTAYIGYPTAHLPKGLEVVKVNPENVNVTVSAQEP